VIRAERRRPDFSIFSINFGGGRRERSPGAEYDNNASFQQYLCRIYLFKLFVILIKIFRLSLRKWGEGCFRDTNGLDLSVEERGGGTAAGYFGDIQQI
jgi:hypothetical protein